MTLVNPLGHGGALRRSLLPSLCETVRANLARLTRDAGIDPSVRLYEIAKAYAWPVGRALALWRRQE